MKTPNPIFLAIACLFPVLAPAKDGVTAAEAAAQATVPPGFKLEVIASEPDVAQPVAFCWDARGRLWVVEGRTYPSRKGPPPPKRADGDGDLSVPTAAQRADLFGGEDRIVIFEDADGDGSFETRKVFIEGLNLVSGIEVGFGGVYLGAAPYLLHIPLAAGGDKPAGDPVILCDGWGYQDTHETLNSFIWGPDGWLYGCHGVFTHSEVRVCAVKSGDPVPPRTKLNAAYWRWHPVRKEFEIFAHGTSNSWGMDYDEFGNFFSEACVIQHFWHIIPGAYYLRQSNPLGHFSPYVYTNIETIADHLHYIGATPHAGNGKSDEAGGGHAHCGLCIYNGDNFPAEHRGRPLMFNIHGRRINEEKLVPEGSGWVAQHSPDFLKMNDAWFSGVSLKVGPDGAVYFIDWYDAQKCHLPKPEVWDRSNGRIYRVKYESGWKPWKGDLAKMTEAELLGLPREKNGWMDRQVRRQLQERAGQTPQAGARTEGNTLRGLWDLHARGLDSEAALLAQTRAALPVAVRAWAVRFLAERKVAGAAVLARFVEMARTDPSPVVRLDLASALQRLPVEARWEIAGELLEHAEDAGDHNLPQMYWYGIEPLVPADPARALALGERSRIPLVSQHIARRLAEADGGAGHLVAAMAKEKTGAGLATLMAAAAEGLRGKVGVAAPPAWEAAWKNVDDVIARRADARESAEKLRDLRLSLAVAFGDQRAFPRLQEQVRDAALPTERRLLALQTLVQGRDAGLAEVLAPLLQDGALRLAALRALPGVAGGPPPALTGAILAAYGTFTLSEKQAAITALAARKEAAAGLLEAVGAGKIPRADVPSFVARQIVDLKDEALTAQLSRVWGKIGDAAATAPAEMAKLKGLLTPAFLKKASPSEGRVLFRQICGTCHTLFGEGGRIAPDLTGSNRGQLDYVLENVTNPNALIGKDYELHMLALKDGRVVSGMILQETGSAFTMQTLTTQEVVAKSDVQKHDLPGISMMPQGLFTALADTQVRDLVSYLASPGPVPLPGEGAVVTRVSGALEGEDMKAVVKKGAATPQAMGGFKAGTWSGASQLWWTGGGPGDRMALTLPVAEAGSYQITACLTSAPDYAIVQLWLDGAKLGLPIDLFSRDVTCREYELGPHDLTAGGHKLVIEITGANPEAVKSYMTGLDYVWLGKQAAAK